jgi:serine phosphatase RsbU (regulator of sigma subunit)
MGERIVKGLVIFVGAVALLLGLLFVLRDGARVANWTTSGFTLSAVGMATDSTSRFFSVDTLDFKSGPYPSPGDSLLFLADSAAPLSKWIKLLEVYHTPGREVSAVFLHHGDTLHTVIRTRAVAPLLKWSVVVLQGLKILIFLAFLLVGFWALFKRMASPAVRALALYCFTMSTHMATAFLPMYAQMAGFRIPIESLGGSLLRTIGVYCGVAWLMLQMLFPRPMFRPGGRKRLVYGLVIVPLTAYLLYDWFGAITRHPAPDWKRFVYFTVIVVQMLIGLYLLHRHHRRAETHLEKRQTKLVLWGSGVPLLLFAVYLIYHFGIVASLYRTPLAQRMLVTDLVFLILLLSPLSFAYAFGRYRLLEIEGRLRRGTRHFIMVVLTVALLLAIGYYASRLVSQSFKQGSFLNVAVTIAVVAAILRGATQLEKALEHRFYPERRRLRQMIHDFLLRCGSLGDRESFWSELEVQLCDSLAVEGVYPVLRVSRNGTFLLRDRLATPFGPSSELVRRLERDARPIMVDEAIAASQVALEPEEITWLTHHRVALVLPLILQGRLSGFLGLGMKVEREDYTAEELRILGSLAPQVALASDNIRLLEENLEKRRMEEELQVARRVQERFLPKDLPPTPGLELAARSYFCREVAGDYYDVIALPKGCTVLAIGDVAGKGAGAALIMANLQASLRALCGTGMPLDELMCRINDLIHQNTQPDQFITLFVAIFDPHDHSLRYVNAGHNFPFLSRSGDGVETLDLGGLILGPFPEATYLQDRLQLGRGDMLLLYTDGVSEAMNEDGDELGEELVRDVFRAHASDSPEQIMDQVMALVQLHQGGRSSEDDQTLLVARVL